MSIQGEHQEQGEGPLVLLACVSAQAPHVFADDTLASCALCGTGISHRPDALRDLPRGARPACFPCASRYAQEHRARGGMVTDGITRRTLDEVARHLGENRR